MSTALTTSSPTRWTLKPRVDIFSNDDGYRLVGDFPGVAPEALDVRLEGDRLVIEGTRTIADEPEVRYRRSFRLQSGVVDPDGLTARLEQGVLTVDLPRSAATRPRTIPVQVS